MSPVLNLGVLCLQQYSPSSQLGDSATIIKWLLEVATREGEFSEGGYVAASTSHRVTCGRHQSPKRFLRAKLGNCYVLTWGSDSWLGVHGRNTLQPWCGAVLCLHRVDSASLPSKDLSVQFSHCPCLDNSLISYWKWHQKDWDCSPLLHPVLLQSGVVVLLSGMRVHIPSRGGPLNLNHLLLHENSLNSVDEPAKDIEIQQVAASGIVLF